MADVKNRIEKIKPYFGEMQVVNDKGASVIYVRVNFPQRWFVSDRIRNKYQELTIVDGNTRGEFVFAAEIETGFDMIFDAIDEAIYNMQCSEERAALLKQKIVELQNLFADESIPVEDLREVVIKISRPKPTEDTPIDIIDYMQKKEEQADRAMGDTQGKANTQAPAPQIKETLVPDEPTAPTEEVTPQETFHPSEVGYEDVGYMDEDMDVDENPFPTDLNFLKNKLK